MAGRNRMNYASQHNCPFQGYSSFEGISLNLNPEQLGTLNSCSQDSAGARRGPEQSVSRRTSQQDGGFLSNRSVLDMVGQGLMPTPTAEPLLNNHGQHLGDRSREGGVLGPGRVHQLSASNYKFHSREKDQFADGSRTTMYPGQDAVGRGIADMGLGLTGGPSNEVVGKGIMVPRYVVQEEPKFALASASENMHDIRYGERQLLREERLIQSPLYCGEKEASFVPPMSPRAMPMSPRRDDVVTMMSPRRDDPSPTIPSHIDPYGDISRMMSPRRDDLSPAMRRDYTDVGLMGTCRSSREEELLQRQDFPMSPRRGAGLTPPMSPRGGWDYAAPSFSIPHLAAPMTPRPYSPPTSPSWRDGVKPPSQWDLLPSNPVVWNGNDREGRIEDTRAYRADIFRGVPQRHGGNFRLEMDDTRDDYRGMGQGWSLARTGLEGGLHMSSEEQDGLFRPPMVYGQGQMRRNFGDHFRDYRATDARQYPYNSGINQRVGSDSKYIRVRSQKSAAGRMKRDSVDFSKKRYNSYTSNNKFSRMDRQEKDARSTAVNSKNVDKSEKKNDGASDKRSVSLVAAIESAAKQSSAERTGDKPDGNKSSNVDSSVGAASAVENANTAQPSKISAVGISSAPSNTLTENESPKILKSVAGRTAGDAQKKDSGSRENVRQNGLLNNTSNGNVQGNSKTESKPGETREARKRPSLVTEIERAKRSRVLAEQRRRIRELEETYYDADELSLDILSKMNKSGSRYSRAFNDDPYLRRRHQGGQTGYHCLFCGKLKSLAHPNQGYMGQIRSHSLDEISLHASSPSTGSPLVKKEWNYNRTRAAEGSSYSISWDKPLTKCR
ncbi:hypothetical protein R1flu_019514 [Riccia fluitans]|uniref:Uncharacterized protein n=1 Tax=Riccia fluitans TaxID=41844 RepID=A0ABD1ZKF2_9MARC